MFFLFKIKIWHKFVGSKGWGDELKENGKRIKREREKG